MPRGPPPPPRAAFTVPEFCEAHRISQAKYYEMKKEGWGPVEMEVGRRRVISYEAASVWRRERERGFATSSSSVKGLRHATAGGTLGTTGRKLKVRSVQDLSNREGSCRARCQSSG